MSGKRFIAPEDALDIVVDELAEAKAEIAALLMRAELAEDLVQHRTNELNDARVLNANLKRELAERRPPPLPPLTSDQMQ